MDQPDLIAALQSALSGLLSEVINDGELVCESRAGTSAGWRTRALIDLETDRPWFAKMRDSFLERVAENGV